VTTTDEGTAERTVTAVDFLKVTEQAAIASARWLGRGERNEADQAAVDAMRRELGEMPITGTVVIGEGQKDEAPELYVGEVLGAGGVQCEIAVDPLEGTDLVARGDSGAVAICAIGEPGGFLSAPDIYRPRPPPPRGADRRDPRRRRAWPRAARPTGARWPTSAWAGPIASSPPATWRRRRST
jgi:hypothetical protein